MTQKPKVQEYKAMTTEDKEKIKEAVICCEKLNELFASLSPDAAANIAMSEQSLNMSFFSEPEAFALLLNGLLENDVVIS